MLSNIYLICAIIAVILSFTSGNSIIGKIFATLLAGIAIGGSFTILFHSITGMM